MTVRRRSVLFTPGDAERKLRRALTSGADVVVVDLEDAVATGSKAVARDLVRRVLGDSGPPLPERVLRVNRAAGGWDGGDAALAAELVAAGRLDGVMLPKVDRPSDLDGFLDACGREVALWPIATETAAGVESLPGVAAHPAVTAVCWGAEDLSLALGAWGPRQAGGALRPVFQWVRARALLGAAAAGVDALDGVYTDLDDDEGLAAEAAEAAGMGFAGKLVLHPRQVPVVHAAFRPPPPLVERAQRLLAARREHPGPGTFRFEGQMVDEPHIRLAERLLARAAEDDGGDGA